MVTQLVTQFPDDSPRKTNLPGALRKCDHWADLPDRACGKQPLPIPLLSSQMQFMNIQFSKMASSLRLHLGLFHIPTLPQNDTSRGVSLPKEHSYRSRGISRWLFLLPSILCSIGFLLDPTIASCMNFCWT
ncbi:hypothetical protein V6Z93_005528 [Aspergillus fumigatus]